MAIRLTKLIFLILNCAVLNSVSADILVLIHGYQGDAGDWKRAGINNRLIHAGWREAGALIMVSGKPVLVAKPVRESNKFITVQLPGEFPLLLQSTALENYLLKLIEAYPGEALILVAHSAGGVVARGMLINAYTALPVKQLITIASPHLGTNTALLGVLTANSPLAYFTPFMGAGTINRSEQLYSDLLPEEPGSLLFALNRQQHPRIEYVSIVRTHAYGVSSDLIVPPESQHLESVYALRGLARSVIAGFGHALQAADGDLILQLVEGPRSL